MTSLLKSCKKLFFGRRFEYHRLGGLLFLVQYIAAILYYIYDPRAFIDSWLVLTVPLFGVLQSVSASYYFRFLPKKVDAAFFGDKYSLSYHFIVENIFFALLLCFAWWYYSSWIMDYVPAVVQYAFIFFPFVWRPLFPKTTFRDSLYNTNNKSDENRMFFTNSSHFVKCVYLFSKHFIGYFLNYLRFLDRVSDEQRVAVYLIFVVGQFSTTVSMFLHTLAFRRYITKKRSMEIYLASLVALVYAWTALYGMIASNLDIALVALIGYVINFSNKYVQHSYQVLVFVVLMYIQYYYEPLSDVGMVGENVFTGNVSDDLICNLSQS